MLTSAWRHTFGRCLRSAGVTFEDRQDLLRHKSARITIHYLAAELLNLVEAAEKVCGERSLPTMTLDDMCKSGLTQN